MLITDVGKLIDIQDRILADIGKCKEDLIISGSFAFVRAFSQHRIIDHIQIFTKNPEKALEKLEVTLPFENKSRSERWHLPEKTYQLSFNIYRDNMNIKLDLIKDSFHTQFEKTKLEIGLYLEDLEGIYHRVLTDLINNPEEIIYIVDTAYIDNEYHLIDFVDIYSKNTGIKTETLILCFKKALNFIEKDRFKTDRILREYGINISSNTLKNWLEAKIEELS